MPKKRFSTKKTQFLDITGKTVEEFINDQFAIGTSRKEIHAKVMDVCNGQLKISTSTIWYWVRDGQADGTIQDFKFGKKGHRKHSDTEIKTKQEQTQAPVESNSIVLVKNGDVPTDEETPVEPIQKKKDKGQLLKVTYTCKLCGHTSVDMTSCESPRIIGLRTYQCHKCQEFGSCIANFEYKGIEYKKDIIDGAYKKEEFVDQPYLQEATTPTTP